MHTNTSWASCRGAHLAPVETFPALPDVTLDVSIQLRAEELDFLLWPRKKSNITMGWMINRPHFKLQVERVRPGWPFDWLRRLAENWMLHLPRSKGCSRGSRPKMVDKPFSHNSLQWNRSTQNKVLILFTSWSRVAGSFWFLLEEFCNCLRSEEGRIRGRYGLSSDSCVRDGELTISGEQRKQRKLSWWNNKP